MKPRTVAILAAVVAALAAFVLFVERELPSTDERRERAGRALALEPDEVTALALEWDGREVRFERAAKVEGEAALAARDWRLVAPISGRADAARIDQLLSSLSSLEVERELEGASRAEIGLEPPRGQVRWTAAGREGSLEVGGEVPASSNVVVAVAGRAEAVVVPRAFTAELERAAADWRARDVLGVERGEIERIRLLPAGGDEIELARRGEAFAVERPFADAADRDAIDPLLAEITGLAAERFVEAPVSADVEAALAAGPGAVELALAGRSEPLLVTLGAETSPGTGERWARAEGLTFATRTRLADSLAAPAADWRSKSWTGFESWRIERIRIADGEGELELVREAGEWKRDGEVVPYGEASDLLFAITSARAASVVPPEAAARYPVTKPALTVVVGDAQGGEETLTLHGGGDAGETVAARVSGRAVVLLLPASAAAELGAKIAAVRAAAAPEATPATTDGAGEPVAAPAPEDPAD
ncbi:MAG: hypothetical protein AMXMBFR36_25220 [Acidobacteriota bacterium]